MSYKGQDLAYGGTLSQEGTRGFGAVALHNQVWTPWMVARALWLLHLLSTQKNIPKFQILKNSSAPGQAGHLAALTGQRAEADK